MRAILFIAAMGGLVVYLFLTKGEVERFDLDQADHKVDQVQQEVEASVEKAQSALDDALADK